LIGFSDRVARRLDEGTLRCELVHNRRGGLARESAVQQDALLVAAEVREVEGGEKAVNTILSLATAVRPEWLGEFFPEDIERGVRVFFDDVARRVFAEEQLRFRELALSARRLEPPPLEESARLLAEEVLAGRLKLVRWDHDIEQWFLRLRLLGEWCPEFQLPGFGENDRRVLVEQICHGAYSYKEIKERDVRPLAHAWLSRSQQEYLDKHAPERLNLPNGRHPKVTYEGNGAPWIALRIQELYDLTATPRIALGRVPILIHVLAPNMRPVQITQDLAGFWRDHYPGLKSELQRKYPKHEWR
jgi:ATP-dependent helicase HrpB